MDFCRFNFPVDKLFSIEEEKLNVFLCTMQFSTYIDIKCPCACDCLACFALMDAAWKSVALANIDGKLT